MLQLTFDEQYFPLLLLPLVTNNLQAFLNTLAYGFTRVVRSEWSALLCFPNVELVNDNTCLEEEQIDPYVIGIGDETGSYMIASSLYSEECISNGY